MSIIALEVPLDLVDEIDDHISTLKAQIGAIAGEGAEHFNCLSVEIQAGYIRSLQRDIHAIGELFFRLCEQRARASTISIAAGSAAR